MVSGRSRKQANHPEILKLVEAPLVPSELQVSAIKYESSSAKAEASNAGNHTQIPMGYDPPLSPYSRLTPGLVFTGTHAYEKAHNTQTSSCRIVELCM